MSNKAIVDFLFMLLFAAVLIVTTHQLSSSTKRVEAMALQIKQVALDAEKLAIRSEQASARAEKMAINAEGRIGTLELFRENVCRDIPGLSDCDIYTEESADD